MKVTPSLAEVLQGLICLVRVTGRDHVVDHRHGTAACGRPIDERVDVAVDLVAVEPTAMRLENLARESIDAEKDMLEPEAEKLFNFFLVHNGTVGHETNALSTKRCIYKLCEIAEEIEGEQRLVVVMELNELKSVTVGYRVLGNQPLHSIDVDPFFPLDESLRTDLAVRVADRRGLDVETPDWPRH